MTYDYGSWADEDYPGETHVTLSVSALTVDGETGVTLVLTAEGVGSTTRLEFTLAPEDTLDLLHRVLRVSDVNLDEVRRVVNEVRGYRAEVGRGSGGP